MRSGIIFMTALVPTNGHARLIRFAAEYMRNLKTGFYDDAELHVVVSTRSFEPRIRATTDDFYHEIGGHVNGVYIHYHEHHDDAAPQNCTTDNEWGYWTALARRYAAHSNLEVLFGSDAYCVEFAKRIGCCLVPCDPYREVMQIKGTDVRNDFFANQDKIIPAWLDYNQRRVVLFGQESVGKTTIAKALSKALHTPFYHEWARPYLEMVGPDLTADKMETIGNAQLVVDAERPNALIKVQDTDILSTIGYYELWGEHKPSETLRENMISSVGLKANETLYLVSDPEGVPFEADPLRYGVDRRETEMKFWVDILRKYGQNYEIISGDLNSRVIQATKLAKDFSGVSELVNFVRD